MYNLINIHYFLLLATVFNGSDMIYEIRRRKPKPTLLPTQGIFNINAIAMTTIRTPVPKVTYHAL